MTQKTQDSRQGWSAASLTPLGTLVLSILFGLAGRAAAAPMQFGFGKAEITPAKPFRLSGYASRDLPFSGVQQKLWTRAMAIKTPEGRLLVLANLDAIGIPGSLTTEIADRLQKKHGIARDAFCLCVTHSHCAPHVLGYAPNIFRKPMEGAELDRAKEYVKLLSDRVVEATDAALEDLAPGRLYWGQGKLSVAANRRVLRDGKWTGFGVQKDGPVDHSLPVLKVAGADGTPRGAIFNYACHCTTLGGDFQQVCGDWAGYAQQFVESAHPGAVALCTIGCGADANPEPRGKLEQALAHGRAVADEVERVLAGAMAEIANPPTSALGYAGLPIDRPDIPQLRQNLKSDNVHVRRHAAEMLDIHERMGRIFESYPCPVQVWRFGDALTMIFLGGEVVVDYALRLKREIQPGNVWVTAYANDVFGYVASERMRSEGGYEVDYSMIYYMMPGRWSAGTEEVLIRRVHELVQNPQGDRPLSPAEAVRSFKVSQGLEIELVACEPLVADPVNVAFGEDGRLWVIEMGDYPRGADDKGAPGGRVKVLEDTDRDGVFDKSTLFLDGLCYPTGVFPWRNGVVISAAPQVLFAEDTDGDNKADRTRPLFEGFLEANPQHRVHGFAYGLDHWLYIGGDNSGEIRSAKTGAVVNMSGRDARIQPDSGTLEAVSGRSQFGRSRDDFDNWFGGNNSLPIAHFVLADRYVGRNPYAALPTPRVDLLAPPYNPPVFPASRTLDRFNDLFTANRFTSACSPVVYRDELLGPEFAQSAFIAEPVHNLVHRAVLDPKGVTFAGRRHPSEQTSEFLASTNVWSRPVRVETGPDGAVWVVDMYRYVIEHPEWIPEAWQARLDLRAGHDKGRIYRVYPKGRRPGALPRLAGATAAELAAELASPNGWRRDTAQRLLLHRQAHDAVEAIEKLLTQRAPPAAKVQALWTLAGLGRLTAAHVITALPDGDARVRAQALRLAEPLLQAGDAAVGAALVPLTADPDGRVRYQLALSLGEWSDPRAGKALGELAVRDLEDQWVRAAVLSSASRFPEEILRAVLAAAPASNVRAQLVDVLIRTALERSPQDGSRRLLAVICPEGDKPAERWQLSALAAVAEALARRKLSVKSVLESREGADSGLAQRIERLRSAARHLADDEGAKEAERLAAVRLLGGALDARPEDLDVLGRLLRPRTAPAVRSAAVAALGKTPGNRVPHLLLADWPGHAPALRAEVLDVLLSRAEWTTALLSAIGTGQVLAADLDAARRERLLKHANEAVRKQAHMLLADLKPASRQKVLEQFRGVLERKPDLMRGFQAFAKTCAVCHRFRGHGTELGPNLEALQDKGGEALLLAILDPNKAVESKYRSYTVATQDGRLFTGMVAEETSTSITLARQDGKRDVILRVDIEDLAASGKSFMPEGLEKDLGPQTLADVIAYVQSRPAALGNASESGRQESRRLFSQWGATGIGRVVAAAGVEPQASWLGRLDMAYCRQTDGRSKVAFESPAVPAALDRTKPYVLRLPAAMGYFSQPAGNFTLSLGGKAILKFASAPGDGVWSNADGSVHMSFFVLQANDEDSTGVVELSVPGAWVEPGKPARLEVVGSASNSRRWFGLLLMDAAQRPGG